MPPVGTGGIEGNFLRCDDSAGENVVDVRRSMTRVEAAIVLEEMEAMSLACEQCGSLGFIYS